MSATLRTGRPGLTVLNSWFLGWRRLSDMGLIITLLIVWLVLSILGFVLEGLLWLAIIGLVLFVGTAVWGWVKRKAMA